MVWNLLDAEGFELIFSSASYDPHLGSPLAMLSPVNSAQYSQ
jgi:hypothetical protein